MLGGAIKLARSLAEHPLLSAAVPAHYLKVFLTLLLMANWRERRWWDGRREVVISPGRLVTSAATIMAKCGITRQQYRDSRAFLVRSNLITSNPTNKYDVITIVDWWSYQWEKRGEEPAEEPPKEPAPNQQTTSAQPHLEVVEVLKSSSDDKNQSYLKVQKEGENSLSVSDDDNHKGPAEEKPKVYTSTRAELRALIHESTHVTPTRRDLTQLEGAIETRGGTLREFIDDIRPRLGRLRQRPGVAFFMSQAQQWNTPGSQPEAEDVPVSAEEQRLRLAKLTLRVTSDGTEIRGCLKCRTTGKIDGGLYCDCQHGDAMARIERRSGVAPGGAAA